jgi:methyl-accepting chemotaxis protein
MIADMSSASRDELIAEIADLKKQLDFALDEIKVGGNGRLYPEHYSDDFKELAFSVNNVLDAVSEQQGKKATFYLSILDSLSLPISVTDLNENWTFINKKTEEMVNIRRGDVLGKHCSAWGANICNTERCGIKALRRGEFEAKFDHNHAHYKALLSYLQSPNGDVIGHVETVVNVTELIWATQYVKNATTALLTNLDQAANGNFALDSPLPVLYGDHDNIPTLQMVNAQFEEIFERLKKVTDTVREVLSDVKEMTVAMHDGRFDHRSDASKYKGEFEQVAEQLNEMLNTIFKPVHDTIRVCKCYAAGDFTARINPDGMTEGEWRDYRSSLDKIGIDVSHQLQTIAKQMDELSLLTEHAGEDIKVGVKGTEQMLEMAEQISNSSSDGSERIEQAVKVMEDLSVSVGETTTRSQRVSSDASQANEYAVAGMEQTQKSGLVMEGITDSTRVLEVMIKDINVQMAEIGKIVQLISDISNQTNLLALNAAIEAARAGDAGRGFAVVASEVKALAQDSRRSAENITDMISSLQEKAKKADQATNNASIVVQQGKVAVDENLSMLEKILSSIGDINQNSLEVASFAEEQTAAVQEATMSIATVADRINHSAKRVGEIVVTTEETGAAITKIGEIFDEIRLTAKAISERIAQFQLSDDEKV